MKIRKHTNCFLNDDKGNDTGFTINMDKDRELEIGDIFVWNEDNKHEHIHTKFKVESFADFMPVLVEIERNEDIKDNSDTRKRNYYKGAEDFAKWLLSNDKYTACMIDTDDNCIVNDVGLIKDNYTVSIVKLLKEFESSVKGE